MVYHCLNRANGRIQIFNSHKDYQLFENILTEAKEKYPIRILAYCVMPNHWHLVLYPENDNDLSLFMRWLTLTHTQRTHATKKNSRSRTFIPRKIQVLCSGEGQSFPYASTIRRA